MNHFFNNPKYKHKMIVDDEGVTIIHSVQKEDDSRWFFPYGSINFISVKMVSVTFEAGDISAYYYFNADKQQFKAIQEEITKLNRLAEKATATYTSTVEEVRLEKDIESFKKHFKSLIVKHENEWIVAIKSTIASMDEDEEIIEGFHGWLLEMNGGRESVVHCMCVITNRRFYYAGADGKKAMFWMKTGAIELKDVHALSVGAGTLTAPAYIKFDVKNDDYKLSTFGDAVALKKKFEEGIKACDANSNKGATIVQNMISPADEILKFKGLLDMGVITQEEFDAKKKQLLGL